MKIFWGQKFVFNCLNCDYDCNDHISISTILLSLSCHKRIHVDNSTPGIALFKNLCTSYSRRAKVCGHLTKVFWNTSSSTVHEFSNCLNFPPALYSAFILSTWNESQRKCNSLRLQNSHFRTFSEGAKRHLKCDPWVSSVRASHAHRAC